MTAERYGVVKEVFLEAIELPPEQRVPFVMRRCDGDDDLAAAVRAMLAADADEAPAVERLSDAVAAVHRELETTVASLTRQGAIGMRSEVSNLPFAAPELSGYRIDRELGRGGMGVVYRAEQERPQRVVAIKMLRADIVSRTGLRRLELEAQLLARLQHPNIASIHESGRLETPDGPRAYFVMEYVDGVPIHEAARRQAPSLETRVRWIVDICRAIDHAHRKGIIHRDLKPDNVLVTADGRPMVLDFGVARAVDAGLGAATLLTGDGMLVGTVPYMSPEQLAADPDEVDTRSDIYALGVLAYEVICGQRAFNVQHEPLMRAMERIRNESPPRLDTLNIDCPLDLALIVDRAMSKLPGRRYASAGEMADDLERFLRHEPILARPSTAIYQFRLYARRNRGLMTGLAGSGLILVASVAGLALLTMRAMAAERDAVRAAEREAAQRSIAVEETERATRAEQGALRVAGFMTHILAQSDRERSRISSAVGFEEPTVVETVNYARPLIAEAFQDWPEHEVQTRTAIAGVLLSRRDFEGAAEESRRAMEQAELHFGPRHERTLAAMQTLGLAYYELRRLDEAASVLEACIERAGEATSPDALRVRVMAQSDLANVYALLNRRQEALTLSQIAAASKAEVLGPGHPATVQSVTSLAILQGQRGDLAGAAARLESAIDALRAWQAEAAGQDRFGSGALAPSDATRDPDVQMFFTLHALAGVLAPLGRSDEAVSRFNETLDLGQRIYGDAHPSVLWVRRNFSNALRQAGRLDEALRMAEQAWHGSREIEGPDAHGTLVAWGAYAEVLAALDRYDEAITAFEGLVAKCVEVKGADDYLTLRQRFALASVYLAAGRPTDALPMAAAVTEALAGAVRVDPRDPLLSGAHELEGRVHVALGQLADAYRAFSQAHSFAVRRGGEDGATARELAAVLAKQADDLGLQEEAVRWRTLAAASPGVLPNEP